MIASIMAQTEDGKVGDFALKFTAFVTLEIMEQWNKAQNVYLYHILQLDSQDSLDLQ